MFITDIWSPEAKVWFFPAETCPLNCVINTLCDRSGAWNLEKRWQIWLERSAKIDTLLKEGTIEVSIKASYAKVFRNSRPQKNKSMLTRGSVYLFSKRKKLFLVRISSVGYQRIELLICSHLQQRKKDLVGPKLACVYCGRDIPLFKCWLS